MQQIPGCFVEDSNGNHNNEDCSVFHASGNLKNKLNEMKAESVCEEPQVDDILLLTEVDIPGASLNTS